MRVVFFCLLLFCQFLCNAQDIVVTSVTGVTTNVRYGTYPSVVTIENNGIVGINQYFGTYVYLSTDNVLDKTTDNQIGYFYTSSLAAGASVTTTPDYIYNNYSGTPPSGTYYLIVATDVDGFIAETNETNNQYILPNYTVTPSDVDFTITNFRLDKTTYTADDLIKPTFLLKNLGTTEVEHFISVQFYLSQDGIYDTNDKMLERDLWDINGAFTFNSHPDFGLTLPVGTVGAYYIIAIADRLNLTSYFEESNEGNNTVAQSIQISAGDVDLEVLSVSTNGNSQINYSVKNNGATGVTGYSCNVSFESQGDRRIYNDVLSDFHEGSDGYLAPGETKAFNLYFDTDHLYNVPAGIYIVDITANEDRTIVENNYTNNTAGSSSTVNVPPQLYPQVSFISLTPADVYDNSDKNLAFNLKLLNSGTQSYYSQYYDLVIKNSANAVVFSKTYPIQIGSAGATNIYSLPVTLTNTLPVGTYSVQWQCSSSCYTSPSTSSINLIIQQVQYTLTGTVNGEDGTPITKGEMFLYEKGIDGTISFIQNAKLTMSNTFNFLLDDHQHTLYFIPDDTTFAAYVPTIYGKTFMLNDNSYFTVTDNMNVAFEVLKVQPLAMGTGLIIGTISQGGSANGRAGNNISLGDASDSYLVLLLSASGQVVSYARTNSDGFYEFPNLPRDQYQIFVSRELDKSQMQSPLTVDISSQNKSVNISISPSGISTSTEIFLFNQLISIDPFPDTHFGDSPINITATADSGLPVVLTSDNPAIAAIEEGKIVIYGAGTVSITALQAGNEFYHETSTSQSLTVNKADQLISFDEIPEQNSKTLDFLLSATASSQLSVSYSSDNESVATVTENKVTIHNAGVAHITASQSGNNNYESASSVMRTLTVNLVTLVDTPLSSITVFPNPTKQFISIDGYAVIDTIELTDLAGRKLPDVRLQSNQVDVGSVPSGVYILKIYSVDFYRKFKIVIE